MIYAAFTNSNLVESTLQRKMYCHFYYNTGAVATHCGVHKAVSVYPSDHQVSLLISPLLKPTENRIHSYMGIRT